jgi:hypothetical protein
MGSWALLLAALTSACKKDDCAAKDSNGQCVAECQDSYCQSGQKCVQNVCSPTCKADSDCADGECKRLTTDHGTQGRYCWVPPKPDTEDAAPGPAPSSDNAKKCTTSADCVNDSAAISCVKGECLTTCALHEHCRGVGACTGDATNTEGEAVHFCQDDKLEHAQGQYGWPCINGSADCDQTNGFRCISSGEGDTAGYCAGVGCEADDACPAGFFCSRDLSANFIPCADSCGLKGDPTDPTCIAADRIGSGKEYACASQGIELHSCRKRAFCSACTTDADCRGIENQICAQDPSGAKICTFTCDPQHKSCPWGSATTCDVYDTELGVPTCAHRAGMCKAAGNSCEPCTDDADCPYGFCSTSSFTGEHFCVDRRDDCSCGVGEDSCFGGGCPMTPGGLEMFCVPASSGAAPSACYGASAINGDETGQLGCWPLEQ